MQKNKKNIVLCLIIMLAIVLVIPVNRVNAEEAIIEDELQIASLAERTVYDLCSAQSEELLGLSKTYFYTEGEYALTDPEYSISELVLSANNISFENNGLVEFVDAIAKLEDGTYVNISEFAEWNSGDINIASVCRGAVYSRGKGASRIEVKYDGKSVYLDVEVEEEVNYLENVNVQRRGSSVAYQRALDIYYQEWSPNSNIYQWGSVNQTPNYFTVGTTYMGYPYTQKVYCFPYAFLGYNSFSSVLNTTKFLRLTTVVDSINEEKYCPYYGLDCSGLVSYALNTNKKYCTSDLIDDIRNGVFTKVGNYNATSPSTSDLISSYASMTGGDALVTNGHCFVVLTNNSSEQKAIVIEQTVPLTAITTYTYSDLADAGYMPFN